MWELLCHVLSTLHQGSLGEPVCCTIGSLRSHGKREGGTPWPGLFAALSHRGGQLQVGGGQLPTLSSRAMASHGGERPVLSVCSPPHPHPGRSWRQETCLHFGRTWPPPQHHCCSREAGPFPGGGMWGGGVIAVSHLVNKEVWLGFLRGGDDSDGGRCITGSRLLTFRRPACFIHSPDMY